MSLIEATKKSFGKVKSLLLLLLLSLSTVGFLVSGGILLKQSLKNNKEVETVNIKLEVLRNNEKILKELLNISSKIDSNIDLAKSSLPEDPSVPYFMKQIERAAEESSLTIDKLAFSKSISSETDFNENSANTTSKFGLVTVQSSFFGDYSSILTLLKKLEYLRRLCSVNLLKISKQALSTSQDESNLNSYNLNLSLITYFSETPTSAVNANNSQNITDISTVDLVSSSDFRRSDLTSILNTIATFTEYSMESDEINKEILLNEATSSSTPSFENLN